MGVIDGAAGLLALRLLLLPRQSAQRGPMPCACSRQSRLSREAGRWSCSSWRGFRLALISCSGDCCNAGQPQGRSAEDFSPPRLPSRRPGTAGQCWQVSSGRKQGRKDHWPEICTEPGPPSSDFYRPWCTWAPDPYHSVEAVGKDAAREEVDREAQPTPPHLACRRRQPRSACQCHLAGRSRGRSPIEPQALCGRLESVALLERRAQLHAWGGGRFAGRE